MPPVAANIKREKLSPPPEFFHHMLTIHVSCSILTMGNGNKSVQKD